MAVVDNLQQRFCICIVESPRRVLECIAYYNLKRLPAINSKIFACFKDLSLESAKDNVSVMSQRPYLFHV